MFQTVIKASTPRVMKYKICAIWLANLCNCSLPNERAAITAENNAESASKMNCFVLTSADTTQQ